MAAGGALATAFVRVEADDKPFLTTVDRSGKTASSNLNKTMAAGGTSSGKKYGEGFAKSALPAFGALGKAGSLALAGGAVVGVAGLTAVFKTGFDEVAQYQKGLAQTNAVIKSTGGVAGVTSKDVEGLASSIQGYSGQTDDSIVAGEDLLLTFTNIRNEAGAGNDVFNQSTKILADMSQALGEDTSAAAIQLGKALNDPIKGVTALQRVGVSFTEEQKAQIKAMVDAGDTMGAQKLILAELNKEFGGSAAAFGKTLPGEIARGKRAFEDFSQGLLTDLMPALNLTFTVVGDVAHLLGGTVHFFESNHDAAAALGAVLTVALIPKLAEMVAWGYRVIALNLAAMFFSASKGAGGLAGAAKNLAGSFNPISVAAAASAFVVVRSWEAQKKAIQEGKQSADDYVATINVIPTSLASLTQATGLINNKYGEQVGIVRDLAKHGDLLSNNFYKQQAALAEYGKALDAQQAKQNAARANEAALGKQYGLTRAQIEQIATGANIDLTGSTDQVTAAFRKQYEVVVATHHPMSQGAKDMLKVADDAGSAADQISALNTALDELAGKSISADEASNNFQLDIIALSAATKAAHGDFSGTTKASLELRNQFSGAAQDAIALANAQKAAGASNVTVKNTLDRAIKSLEKAGGDNAYVRSEVNKLKAAEHDLAGAIAASNAQLAKTPTSFRVSTTVVDPKTGAITKHPGLFVADTGGVIPGRKGEAVPMIGHGMEWVLNERQQQGVAEIVSLQQSAIAASLTALNSLLAGGPQFGVAPAVVHAPPARGMSAGERAILGRLDALIATTDGVAPRMVSGLNGTADQARLTARTTVRR